MRPQAGILSSAEETEIKNGSFSKKKLANREWRPFNRKAPSFLVMVNDQPENKFLHFFAAAKLQNCKKKCFQNYAIHLKLEK